MESSPAADPRRWQALALVCVAFFMTVLDVSRSPADESRVEAAGRRPRPVYSSPGGANR